MDANRLAESLFGTHLAANIFLIGCRLAGRTDARKSLDALDQAIELNGVEVEKNRQAFLWGRKYYEDAAWVEQHAVAARSRPSRSSADPIELRATRITRLSKRCLRRASISSSLDEVGRRAPALETGGRAIFVQADGVQGRVRSRAVADEAGVRGNGLQRQWEAVESISYNLHPPLLRRFGVSRKLKLGGWFASAPAHAGRDEDSCAARRSTCSDAARIAAWSARSPIGTRISIRRAIAGQQRIRMRDGYRDRCPARSNSRLRADQGAEC